MSTGLIVRDARDWTHHHREQIQQELQRVDGENIRHIDECLGCPTCDGLMDFYSGCSSCGRTAHKEAMFYDPASGHFTCEDCADREQSPAIASPS